MIDTKPTIWEQFQSLISKETDQGEMDYQKEKNKAISELIADYNKCVNDVDYWYKNLKRIEFGVIGGSNTSSPAAVRDQISWAKNKVDEAQQTMNEYKKYYEKVSKLIIEMA